MTIDKTLHTKMQKYLNQIRNMTTTYNYKNGIPWIEIILVSHLVIQLWNASNQTLCNFMVVSLINSSDTFLRNDNINTSKFVIY